MVEGFEGNVGVVAYLMHAPLHSSIWECGFQRGRLFSTVQPETSIWRQPFCSDIPTLVFLAGQCRYVSQVLPELHRFWITNGENFTASARTIGCANY